MKPTASKVFVNGKETSFEAYTIAGNNFFKLRDLAYVLNGTSKQFSAAYDGATKAISLTSKTPYTPVGGEMTPAGTEAKTATPTASSIYVDGIKVDLVIYTIGSNNFFKLRDIAKLFNIRVSYDSETRNIRLDTTADYTD